MDKKNLMAPYQQSFRIDDLLTRKASEQQPGHFCPPPLHSSNTLQSPPLGQAAVVGGASKMEKALGSIPCQANGKVFLPVYLCYVVTCFGTCRVSMERPVKMATVKKK